MPKDHIAKNLNSLRDQLEEKRGELKKIPDELHKLKERSEELGKESRELKTNSTRFFEVSGLLTENNEEISHLEDRQAKLPIEIASLEKKITRCDEHLQSRIQQFELGSATMS